MGHLHTINKHRFLVMKHCFKVGIPFQGLRHDLSKYSPSELIPGIKYFQGDRSPNEKERELFGYSKAWLHHKGRNRHHFEYWFDVSPVTHRYEPVKMPLKYLAEMFCDRVAASKIYKKDKYRDSDAFEYFDTHAAKNGMNRESSALLSKWLLLLAEKGEGVAFREVKEAVKKAKKEKNQFNY